MASRLDPRGARFVQASVGVGALAAFVLDSAVLVAALAVLLGVGAAFGPARSPLAWVWRRAVMPVLRLGAPAATKPAAPVRFAQAVGFAFLLVAALLLVATPLAGLAWGLVLIVAALALLAAAGDVCVGCHAYVWLVRAGVRG